MTKKLIFFLLLTGTLVFVGACSDDTTLNSPTGLNEEAFKVSWDPVKEAESYIVRINGDEHLTNATEYSLNDYSEGSYTVKIRAINNTTQSPYSSPLEVTIPNPFPTLETIDFTDGIMTWEDTGASSYTVEINGKDKTVTKPEIALDPNQTYEIRFKAVYNDEESRYSPIHIIHNHETIDSIYTVKTSHESTQDIFVYLEHVCEHVALYVADSLIDTAYYALEDNRIQIDRTVIEGHENTVEIEMVSSEGRWLIEVLIDDAETPRLSSNRHMVYTEGLDVHVHFETFDYSIESLKGSTNDALDDSEYTIEAHRIIIDHRFIDRIFEKNPDRSKTVMLIATLDQEGGTVIEPFSVKVP